MGITVAYFDVDNFNDYLNMLDICTDITERKDLYEQNGLFIKSKIDEIKTRYANSSIPEKERKIRSILEILPLSLAAGLFYIIPWRITAEASSSAKAQTERRQ